VQVVSGTHFSSTQSPACIIQLGNSPRGAFDPVDAIGPKSQVGTSTEGAVVHLDSAGVEGLRVTFTEETGGSLLEVGSNELAPVEKNEGSRYNMIVWEEGQNIFGK